MPVLFRSLKFGDDPNNTRVIEQKSTYRLTEQWTNSDRSRSTSYSLRKRTETSSRVTILIAFFSNKWSFTAPSSNRFSGYSLITALLPNGWSFHFDKTITVDAILYNKFAQKYWLCGTNLHYSVEGLTVKLAGVTVNPYNDVETLTKLGLIKE